MSMFFIDDHELRALAVNFGKVSAETTTVLVGVFKEGGNDLRDEWKANARATSGQHGKHYPDSILAKMRLSADIEVEVGPDPSLPQGGMSFEYGSVNQPPHLDGQRAADTIVPRFERRVETTMAALLGGL